MEPGARDPSAEAYPRETPADPPGRFVDVAGGHAHVVIDGDLEDPVVAFIHGIPGNTRDARYLGPALARRGLCCVRIDMPGFGKTPRATEPSGSAVTRAAWVRDLLAALGVARFAVAGHSIGGAVALALAAHHPVRALLLINSVGVTRHHGLVVPASVHRVMRRIASTPLGDTMAKNMERYYVSRGLKSQLALDADAVVHHLAIVSALDFVEQRRHARAVRAPVMLFSTDDDGLVQPSVTTSLRDALVGAARVAHLKTTRGGHHGQKIGASPIADWCAAELVG